MDGAAAGAAEGARRVHMACALRLYRAVLMPRHADARRRRAALLTVMMLFLLMQQAYVTRRRLLLALSAGAPNRAQVAVGAAALACGALAHTVFHGGSPPLRRWSDVRDDGAWRTKQVRWSDAKFRRYYRVSRRLFTKLCADLSDPALRLERRNNYGRGVSIQQVVGACLRRLASGGDLFDVAEAHDLSESLLHNRMRLFCKALIQLYCADCIKLPTEEDELRRIMRGFEAIAGFPLCCGCMDGVHMPWRSPADKTGECLNHKGWTSVNTLLLSDCFRKIRCVHTGFAGGTHDARVFAQSSLGELMLSGQWPPRSLTGLVEGVAVRPYVVVDAAFPDCDGAALKPYPGGMLQDGHPFKRNFNYRQSATRMPSEHVNGMLKRRWRVLLTPNELWDINDVVDVIVACCILHNLCVDLNDNDPNEHWGDETEADAARMGQDVDISEEDVRSSGVYQTMHAIGIYAGC